MKIKYPDGNKPKGFAVLDEDGKLPSSILPEGAGGGGVLTVHADLTDVLDKTCGEIMDAFLGGSVVQFIEGGDSEYGIYYLSVVHISEGEVFLFGFGDQSDGAAFMGTGRDSYPTYYDEGSAA